MDRPLVEVDAKLRPLFVVGEASALRKDEIGAFGVVAVGDHHPTQVVAAVAGLDVDRPVSEAAKLPRLEKAAPGRHRLDHRTQLTVGTMLELDHGGGREGRDEHPQRQRRSQEHPHAQARGPHGEQLGIRREPAHGKEHAEEEGHGQGVRGQHRDEAAHHHEEVGEGGPDGDDVVETSQGILAHQHGRQGDEAQARVLQDLEAEVAE